MLKYFIYFKYIFKDEFKKGLTQLKYFFWIPTINTSLPYMGSLRQNCVALTKIIMKGEPLGPYF